MTHSVKVRHNFETGHRLPHLGGKCQNLHGHSWWAEVEVDTHRLDSAGTVVEFGLLKKHLRDWIDSHLDHGLMLGNADPLADLLAPHGKVHVFGQADSPYAYDLAYPTVENVAVLLARVTADLLQRIGAPDTVVVRQVTVSETHVNSATWTRS